MRSRIILIGIIISLISFLIMGAPFSDRVSSIAETYAECQKGTDDLRAAFLMARGVCEPSQVTYYVLLIMGIIGIIILIIGIIKKKVVPKTTY